MAEKNIYDIITERFDNIKIGEIVIVGGSVYGGEVVAKYQEGFYVTVKLIPNMYGYSGKKIHYSSHIYHGVVKTKDYQKELPWLGDETKKLMWKKYPIDKPEASG